MTWNHRIMRRIHKPSTEGFEPFVEFGLHEVYYDDDGTIDGWSEEPRPLVAESREVFNWLHEKLGEAIKKPWLDADEGGRELLDSEIPEHDPE